MSDYFKRVISNLNSDSSTKDLLKAEEQSPEPINGWAMHYRTLFLEQLRINTEKQNMIEGLHRKRNYFKNRVAEKDVVIAMILAKLEKKHHNENKKIQS